MVTVAVPSLHVRPRTVAAGALLATSVALLGWQVRDVSFGDLFAQLHAGWLALAVAAFVVSLGAAAHNISAFAPLRLRAADTMRAQLAVGALRIVAPAAVSTPAIGARFLARSGLAMPEALAVVATAQAAQLLATVVVVGTIAAVGSSGLPMPDGRAALGVAVGALVVAAVAAAAARHNSRVRTAVRNSASAVRAVGAHLRTRPVRVVSGLGASAALTLAHVAVFACCVHAVGGDASVLALTAVFLGASSAGSLVPTPAGVGAVEAALVSGLVATGVPVATATAAALLTRLVTVWVPALPGWWAMRSLRRAALL